MRAGLRKHQLHILQVLANPRLRRKFARHHQRPFDGSGVGACRRSEHQFEKLLRRNAELFGEHHAFGKDRTVEAQYQIGRKLGARAHAGTTGVQALWCDGVEQGRMLRNHGGITAHEHGGFARRNLCT